MRGCITGKDVLRHPVMIYRLWGARCLLRCVSAVMSGRRCTFLELVAAPAPARRG
jgi:hypothetical protein